jgi:hypothetical protein
MPCQWATGRGIMVVEKLISHALLDLICAMGALQW